MSQTTLQRIRKLCRLGGYAFLLAGLAPMAGLPALAAPPQQAEPAPVAARGSDDRRDATLPRQTQPLHIEAQSLRYDERQRRSVFSGSVVMTQGLIVLRADRMEFHEDAQGQVHGTMHGLDGKVASFRQHREGGDEFVEGEAQTITYDAVTTTVTLRQRARLRKYRGAVLSDAFEAQMIVYDGEADRFELVGQPAAGPASAVGSGHGTRVRAMISPRASAPATPTQAPILLRSSTGIDAPGL
ncbi:lipopolysaccharide transport periplasmic protein LptA [Candidatus Symbiobacter mobilis]|nr:lipopolysaccharide transport periplasmic protein LptA [Candidatus Symbiobacter mobilis]